MNNFETGHPADGDLLGYLDGELQGRDVKRMEDHLAACWQCRAELQELQRTIAECVQYRKTVNSSLPEPPEPWFDIYRRFDQAGTLRTPVMVRLWNVFRPIVVRPQPWAAAAVLALAVWAAVDHFRREAEPAPAKPAPAAAIVRVPLSQTEASPAPAPQTPRADTPRRDIEQAPTPGDELRVLAVLHRLGADLGEPVEVTRGSKRVLVAGIGVAPHLQRQIEQELEGMPRVIVHFSEPAAVIPPPVAGIPGAVGRRTDLAALESQMETHLGGRTAYEEFASDVLDTSDAAMSRVHALHRLAEQFPPEVESKMTRAERALLTGLRLEHAAALQNVSAALNARAMPVLSLLGGQPPQQQAPAPAPSWQAAAEQLFQEARNMESLLGAMLGGAATNLSAEDLPVRILSSLAAVHAYAQFQTGTDPPAGMTSMPSGHTGQGRPKRAPHRASKSIE
ncbi:MAG: zf-HC2 domain-containing protein [Bryobacteraceae bacterium]|nr:zf-HC2 domain-containing protein [Bryobacterales bacterium]NUN00936.1 zf-HC2 domain-containing protein [Bryobacteraceae bacterium]